MIINKKLIIALLIFMFSDILIYVDIVNFGFLVKHFAEPVPPDCSLPANFGLYMLWVTAHMPASFLFVLTPPLESFIWLAVLNDILIAAIIFGAFRLIQVIKGKITHNSRSHSIAGSARSE